MDYRKLEIKLHQTPDLDSPIIAVITYPEAEQIIWNETYGDWYFVESRDGQKGFCPKAVLA